LTILGLCCLWETIEAALLERKARRLRKETHNLALRLRLEKGSEVKGLGQALVMPDQLFFYPPVFLVPLVTAIEYAWICTLYYTLSATFYCWGSRRVGLAYLGTAAGILVGMIAGGLLGAMVVGCKARKGDRRSETRLSLTIFFWPLVGIGLISFGWTAEKHTHWIWPMLGTGVFGAGLMSTMVSHLLRWVYCIC
jgi:hypothetical protein